MRHDHREIRSEPNKEARSNIHSNDAHVSADIRTVDTYGFSTANRVAYVEDEERGDGAATDVCAREETRAVNDGRQVRGRIGPRGRRGAGVATARAQPR